MTKVKQQATIEDLYKIPENGKAELMNGEIVLMSPTGDLPNIVAGAIYVSLRLHSRNTRLGRAYTDNIGYKVNIPNRKSFSPDASFYIGNSTGMKFLEGAPIFAVEVRSENDYGNKAEKEIKKKREDYFLAGTQVVWEIDLLNQDLIKSYRYDDPNNPIIFRRGDIAHAEPALPNWSIPVDEMFL